MKWIKASDNINPPLGKILVRFVDTGDRYLLNLMSEWGFKVEIDYRGYCYKKEMVEWLDESETPTPAGNGKTMEEILKSVKDLPTVITHDDAALKAMSEYAAQQCADVHIERLLEINKLNAEIQKHEIDASYWKLEAYAKYAEILRLREFIETLLVDPYSEDIFLPIPTNVLQMIHETLKEEYKMPLDRLSGHIGRLLRNPIRQAAKAALNP